MLVFPTLNPALTSTNFVDISFKFTFSPGNGIIFLLILNTFSAVALLLSVTTILSVCRALSSNV